MKITDIRVRKIIREGRLRAVVSVTFEEMFVVHDIKIIEGDDGMFIAMPSRKTEDGQYRDITHPINTEFRKYMQESIIAAYMENQESTENIAEVEQ